MALTAAVVILKNMMCPGKYHVGRTTNPKIYLEMVQQRMNGVSNVLMKELKKGHQLGIKFIECDHLALEHQLAIIADVLKPCYNRTGLPKLCMPLTEDQREYWVKVIEEAPIIGFFELPKGSCEIIPFVRG